MDIPHYWTADQVKRLLDALASHNRHQARTAALIMWRTGLRVFEVLELNWCQDGIYIYSHTNACGFHLGFGLAPIHRRDERRGVVKG